MLLVVLLFYFCSIISPVVCNKNDDLESLMKLKKIRQNTSGLRFFEKIKLKIAEEKLEKKLGILGEKQMLENSLKRKILFVAQDLPIWFWQVMTLFLWILSLSTIMQIFKPKKIYTFMLILFFLSSAFFLLLSVEYHRQEVLVEVLNSHIYTGPDKNLPVINKIVQGTALKVFDEQNGFLRVKNKNNDGWVCKLDVSFI